MDCVAVQIEDLQNGRQYAGTKIVLPQIPHLQLLFLLSSDELQWQ